MAAARPFERMFVEPMDGVEHLFALGGVNWIALAIWNWEGVRGRPGRGMRVERRDLDRAPVEELALLGQVHHSRHFPDAVDVHRRLARSEERDRGGIFGLGGRRAGLDPLLHF